MNEDLKMFARAALKQRLAELSTEREKVLHLLESLDATRKAPRKIPYKLSAAGRKRIVDAQKARWAKARKEKS